jgi:acetamidase/formamidase
VHYFRFDDARTTAEFVHWIRLSMAPFLGVVGTEPAGYEQVSAIVSAAYGGNLVLKDLTAGSHLFLPVMKPGGRIWTGDVHALQGDGVVDQTAIETAAEDLEVRYDLHKNVPLRGPVGETDTSWIVVAFAARARYSQLSAAPGSRPLGPCKSGERDVIPLGAIAAGDSRWSFVARARVRARSLLACAA